MISNLFSLKEENCDFIDFIDFNDFVVFIVLIDNNNNNANNDNNTNNVNNKKTNRMQRFVKMLDLIDDPKLIAEYKKTHDEIPAQIVEGIRAVGIASMDLYLLGNRAVMIMECPDDIDVQEAMQKLATLPGQEEWEKRVAKFQQCNPEDSSAEKWQPMTQIFELPQP